jgi:YjbE family integral membrane protein
MDLASGLLSVTLINIVLSGDNAIVIGMAAAPLTPRRRRLAIVIGGALAIALRIALTWLAAALLQIPALGALGGGLLLWIAFRLLKAEEETVEGAKASTTLGGAIFTIALADVVMSFDNVLGVAAAARGAVGLLMFGLAGSMAIVIAGGGLLASIISRFWWLAYVGAAVIAWTAAQMVFGDPWVLEATHGPLPAQALLSLLVTAAVLVAAHLHRRPRRGTTSFQ